MERDKDGAALPLKEERRERVEKVPGAVA